MSETITVSTDNFEQEVLQSDVPVLVDFWAPWCGPCKMIAPVLEQLAADYAGKLKIAKVNVEEHGELAGKYGVQSIPNLVLFKAGSAVASKIGAVPKPDLVSFIDENL